MLDDIERLEQMCIDILDNTSKEIDRLLPRTGPDTHRPTDMELVAFASRMNQLYPPQPWVRPDGTTVNASAYLLALSECEGGKAIVKRIQGLLTPAEEVF